MRPSIGVTLAGVITVAGSTLCLAFGALLIAITFVTLPNQPPFAKSALYVGAGFFLLLTLWGTGTAIGLFRLQRWARLSMLVFAGLLLFTSLIALVTLLLISIPTSQAQEPEQVVRFARIFTAAFYGPLVAIGGWWIYLFNKKATKEQFRAGVGMVPGSDKPVSIRVIAWILLIGALLIPVPIFLHTPGIALGFVVTGWTATVWNLVTAALQASIGIGLLRLRPLSRVVAIYYFTFGFMNGVLFWVLPGREARFGAFMQWTSRFTLQAPTLPTPVWILSLVWGAVFYILVLWILITRKQAFVKTAPNEAV